MKRHIYQIHPNKHETQEDLSADNETYEAICNLLYDRGVTLRMISKVFKEIEAERQADQMSDHDVYQL